MDHAIHIAGVDKKSIDSLNKTIMAILNAPHVDEKTKQMALRTLGKGVSAPQYTTVSNCSFVNNPPKLPDNSGAPIVGDNELED